MKTSIKYAIYIGLSLGLANATVFLDSALAFWYGSVLIEDKTDNTITG